MLIVRTGPGFGDQVLAQSQRSLNRYNPGSADLNVTSINPTDGAFKLKPLPAFPFPIPAGRSHTVRIEFESPAPGYHRGTFTIATDIPGSSPTKVRVSGTSVAAGRARLSARAPLRFGFVEVGDTVRLPITIRNTGTKPMTVSAIDLDPKGSQAITIVRLTPLGTILTLTPAFLASGEAMTFEVEFAPTTSGRAESRVDIQHNGLGGVLSIKISGIGTTAAADLVASVMHSLGLADEPEGVTV